VFVDLRQYGIAKHIGLLEPISAWVDDAFGPNGALGAEGLPLAPARASERIAAAIRRTDEHDDAVLGESFAPLRAFALARAGVRAIVGSPSDETTNAQARAGADAAWLN
jgi:hypothetical protein